MNWMLITSNLMSLSAIAISSWVIAEGERRAGYEKRARVIKGAAAIVVSAVLLWMAYVLIFDAKS